MEKEHGLSIWFFVGGILTIYGIIILIANIPAFFHHLPQQHMLSWNDCMQAFGGEFY
jgi:hypothetical protein